MSTTADPAEVPFHLSGNYAPVFEETTALDLEVIGEIPGDLAGTYVRNGPNPRNGPSPHWFLGKGMLHGVRLESGRARWYKNRAVGGRSTSNTHVIPHAGRILALVETAPPVEVTRDLDTVGPFDFEGRLPRSMTAHPKTCPVTGELVFFDYGVEPPFLAYYRADASGKITHATDVPVAAPTYMHDFAITERHAVFFDLPVLFHGWRSAMPVEWSDTYGARLGVLPRGGRGDDVRWFPIRPCSIGHTVNAYEDGDFIVLDVCRAPRFDAPSALHRFTLDLRTGAVHEEALDSRFVEFPRIDDRRAGLAHRFAYTIELRNLGRDGAPRGAVPVKYDVTARTSCTHDPGAGRVAGECVIVPRPHASAEDDAWAIQFVYDTARNTSDLVILDAARFDAPAVATVRLPCRVPFGFHGSWLADEPS